MSFCNYVTLDSTFDITYEIPWAVFAIFKTHNWNYHKTDKSINRLFSSLKIEYYF